MILQPQWAQVGAMAWIAHSKLSNTWVSPALVISIVLSYSLPQTSHWAMACLLESGSGYPVPGAGATKMTSGASAPLGRGSRLGPRSSARRGLSGGRRLRGLRHRGGRRGCGLGGRRRLLLRRGLCLLVPLLGGGGGGGGGGAVLLLGLGLLLLAGAAEQRGAAAALADRLAREQLGRGEHHDPDDERDRRRRGD